MTEEAESELQFGEILKETDLFKLAIRGHAAIEELIRCGHCRSLRGKYT
jgi:hypothetical protein